MAAEKEMIPLCRPLLPGAAKIAPYWERIDRNRYYSNTGPLALELEERLGRLFSAPCVSASSATSALTATLLALRLPKGSRVAVPSWTFSATPAAIVAAGHIPCFVDVDKDGKPKQFSPAAKAAVIVAPFGDPLDTVRWDRFSEKIKIPVIIDAAAGFDTFSTVCRPGKCPVVISTHATKVFGTGEGGFVTCQDSELLREVRRICNFGITEEREVRICGINAKMSEYHAAVGLAELDGWKEKRGRWMEVSKWYEDGFGPLGSESALSTCHLHVPSPAVDMLISTLARQGIQAGRARYGCHRLAAYAAFPSADLPVTEELMGKTVMLPMFVDMTKEQVQRVGMTVHEVLR